MPKGKMENFVTLQRSSPETGPGICGYGTCQKPPTSVSHSTDEKVRACREENHSPKEKLKSVTNFIARYEYFQRHQPLRKQGPRVHSDTPKENNSGRHYTSIKTAKAAKKKKKNVERKNAGKDVEESALTPRRET